MTNDSTRRSVLLIGKSQRVLDDAVAGLRARGHKADATNDFGEVTRRFDVNQIDVIVFGRQVPADRKAELKDEIAACSACDRLACGRVVGAPANDAEAVPDREVEPGAIVMAIGSLGDGDEPADHRVLCAHDSEQAVDFGWVAHKLGTERDVMPAEPDAGGLPLDEVELPSPSTRREQRLRVTDVADWLSVSPAGLASCQVDEHEPFAERCRDRQRKDGSHCHVDDPEHVGHDAQLDASRERQAGFVFHHVGSLPWFR